MEAAAAGDGYLATAAAAEGECWDLAAEQQQ